MLNRTAICFSQSYDLEGRIDMFLARRSSELAANPAARVPLAVELVGIDAHDRRLAGLRSASALLALELRFRK